MVMLTIKGLVLNSKMKQEYMQSLGSLPKQILGRPPGSPRYRRHLSKVHLSMPTCSKTASEMGNKYIHLSESKNRGYPYRTF